MTRRLPQARSPLLLAEEGGLARRESEREPGEGRCSTEVPSPALASLGQPHPALRGEGNALPERNRQSMMLHQSTINNLSKGENP